jgi:hypothetical protein
MIGTQSAFLHVVNDNKGKRSPVMRYHCTPNTDLHELIGRDGQDGFEYGPLSNALRNGEDLVLEESHLLSRLMVTKIQSVLRGLFSVETEETLRAPESFRLVLH